MSASLDHHIFFFFFLLVCCSESQVLQQTSEELRKEVSSEPPTSIDKFISGGRAVISVLTGHHLRGPQTLSKQEISNF